jgi:hypothetical protein
MDKKVLWVGDSYDCGGHLKGMLIEADQISQMIDAYDWSCRLWEGTPYREITIPETVLIDGESAEFEGLDSYELMEALDQIVGEAGEDHQDCYFQVPTSCLGWDYYNKKFFDPSGLDTVGVYEWHDGSNWKQEAAGEDTVYYGIEIVDTYDLDCWDGNNTVYSGVGEHANVHKIILDGDAGTNLVLWEDWSQWEGNHPMGELMTPDEVIARLEEDYSRGSHPEMAKIARWLKVECAEDVPDEADVEVYPL